LSASADHTLWVSQLSSRAVVARTKLSYIVNCAAIVPGGRLAVCGKESGGETGIIDAPSAAADVLKAHGAAAFPEPRRYGGIDFYWIKRLYWPTRLLVLGYGDDICDCRKEGPCRLGHIRPKQVCDVSAVQPAGMSTGSDRSGGEFPYKHFIS
jgi:hypothetical protein